MRVALGSIAESVDYGLTTSARHEPVGPKFLRITDLQNGTVDWDSVPWCEADEKKIKSARLNSGDIVFTRTGATTGKSFLIRECPEDAVFASYLIRVRLSNKVDSRYIAHFFQTPDYWNQITQNARGAAQPGVNATKLKSLEIPLPSLAEQKRIAAILDATDALRAKRREALTQPGNFIQSTFIDMFGDPVINPMGWEVSELRNLGHITTGKTPPTKSEGMFGGDIPFATPGDLDNGLSTTVRMISREGAKFTKVVRAGSTLVGCIGNIGKIAKSPVPTAFNQQINAIEWSEKIDDVFGALALRYCIPQMLEKASSTTVPILNKTGFGSVCMIAPPLDLQRRFGAIVESVEQQKAKMRAHLAELDALFASLQHRAFNGEL